jgi:hypothetical protein
MNAMLKNILSENPDFLGIWTIWEPNALDENDSMYIDTEGHDGTGRFIPYWYWSGGSVHSEPCVSYDVPGDGDYYLLARNSGMETILEPFEYNVEGKTVLMTSIVAPIVVDGKVLDAVGVDISLESLQSISDEIKLMETGYGTIISNSGIYVTHPVKELVGTNMLETEIDQKEEIQKALKDGVESTTFQQDKTIGKRVYSILTPVEIGNSKTPWAVSTVVSIDEVTEKGSVHINEDHAENVKHIFAMLIEEHKSPAEIAKKLNNSGIPSPRMKQWSRVTVRRMLSNPSYMGTLYIRRYDTRDCYLNKFKKKGEKIKVKERPRNEWIPINIPRIVDKCTWEKAQEVLKESKRLSEKRYRKDFILAPLLRCGICGGLMNGKAVTKGDKTYRYYFCPEKYKSVKQGGCKAAFIRAEDIEKEVWNKIYNKICIFVTKEADLNKAIEQYMSDRQNEMESIFKKKLHYIIENILCGLDSEDKRYVYGLLISEIIVADNMITIKGRL